MADDYPELLKYQDLSPLGQCVLDTHFKLVEKPSLRQLWDDELKHVHNGLNFEQWLGRFDVKERYLTQPLVDPGIDAFVEENPSYLTACASLQPPGVPLERALRRG